jgi:oxygen-independent coproporphyrinogen-3 oxidase
MPPKYFEKIRRHINLEEGAEFTIEANPKTLSSQDLLTLKDLGINRISIGFQSFNDHDLHFLGRGHSVSDSLRILESADKLGFRTSADFIYGLPNQVVDDVADMCHKINELGLSHVSLYELTLEKGVPLFGIKLPDESVMRDMYIEIQNNLNLTRYEVSNYGAPCCHNSNIWAGEEYIGIGESAAGRIKIANWFETKIINGKIVSNQLTDYQRMVEIIILGLRTTKGVSLKLFDRIASSQASRNDNLINWDFVNSNPEYFIFKDDFLSMTISGILILDSLLPSIIK